jgi:glycosyltransferase involved in cell wall biosynthesis
MTVFLVDLEAVETRYTGQWKTHVPHLLEEAGHAVTVIQGPTDIPNATTPGAFLNFGGTNIYKARQVEEIARLFTSGTVVDGDHFLFTDAWHPGIINLKYMAELLGIKVKIHALWHAGSYDPQDFLGRLIGDADWVRHSEKAFFHAIDYNYFATDFHIDIFEKNLFAGDVDKSKIIRTGWPMEYMQPTLEVFKELPKRDLILFPHRIAPEKQVEIFRDLAASMPEYEWIVCQDTPLSKVQYHVLLASAKIVFSANLQETLGISMYEGALLGAIPLVPDRLSYSEMFAEVWKYPSSWTESFDSYLEHKQELIALIRKYMTEYDDWRAMVPQQAFSLRMHYFSATALLNNIK